MSKAHADLVEAAQYLRMSTDQQRFSLQFQAAKIAEFAAKRGFRIVETYADHGRSGLTIKGRSALTRLLTDVISKQIKFKAILVYDVSRWGRFQDVDESAHYEFICRSAGVAVHYCAETFENDGSIYSSVMKLMKRAMAGEFSRDLSRKTFDAQCHGAKRGFHQGGGAGFGLRRLMVDLNGRPIQVLERGQHKAFRETAILLVPGPDAEVKIVRQIFSSFVEKRLSISRIANELNRQVYSKRIGILWSATKVRATLKNERYIGNQIYNRTSCKLKSRRVSNCPADWIRSKSSFPPIVEPSMFDSAQRQLATRWQTYTDDELLDRLRTLGTKVGYLTTTLINSSPDMPASATYIARFGSMKSAYERVGMTSTPCWKRRGNELTSVQRQKPIDQLIRLLRESYDAEPDPEIKSLLRIDETISILIVAVEADHHRRDYSRWRVPLFADPRVSALVILRLSQAGRVVSGFHVVPSYELAVGRILLLDDGQSQAFNKYIVYSHDQLVSRARAYGS